MANTPGPYITPMQAVAWIMTRNPAITARDDLTTLKLDLETASGTSSHYFQQSTEIAIQELTVKLQDGWLSMYAKKAEDQNHEAIPAIDWNLLRIKGDMERKENLQIYQVNFEINGPKWLYPLLVTEHVLQIWRGELSPHQKTKPEYASQPGVIPNKPYLTFNEILTWAALGHAKTLKERDAEWKYSECIFGQYPEDLLYNIDCALSDYNYGPGEHCPIIPKDADPTRAFYPVWCNPYAQFRGQAQFKEQIASLRRHYQKQMSLSEIADHLRKEISISNRENELTDAALKHIMYKLGSGELKAHAVLGSDPIPIHKIIPKETFRTDLTFYRDELRPGKNIHPDTKDQIRAAIQVKQWWRDVQFDADDARKLRPETGSTAARIESLQADGGSTKQNDKKPKRRGVGRGIDDTAALEQMHQLITKGAANGPWQATDMVVDRAKDETIRYSERKRLLSKYPKEYGQPGQT